MSLIARPAYSISLCLVISLAPGFERMTNITFMAHLEICTSMTELTDVAVVLNTSVISHCMFGEILVIYIYVYIYIHIYLWKVWINADVEKYAHRQEMFFVISLRLSDHKVLHNIASSSSFFDFARISRFFRSYFVLQIFGFSGI